MIIVSQDNKKIFNFNNISLIFIQHENEIWIDTEKTCNLLGKYATEQRAKEVLQEIITHYRDYRTAECDGYTNVLQETAVFEIPEK